MSPNGSNGAAVVTQPATIRGQADVTRALAMLPPRIGTIGEPPPDALTVLSPSEPG